MDSEQPDPHTVHELLLRLAHEIEQEFGDREPSEDELKAFLRRRLEAEGRTPEEVEQIMAELDAEG